MSYKAVTFVRCGQIYPPGQLIPDGVLSDRDIQDLLKLGSIETDISSGSGNPTRLVLPQQTSQGGEPSSSPVSLPLSGGEDTPKGILEYVNSADEEELAKIKGIGKATAKAMASHGTFASIEELTKLVPNVNWDSIQVTDNKV